MISVVYHRSHGRALHLVHANLFVVLENIEERLRSGKRI